MRNLPEIRAIAEKIDEFSKNYRHLFVNPYGYFSIEEYLELLTNRLDAHFLNFQYHYPFKVSFLEELKDKILLTYQPSDKTQGFMGSFIRIDDSLHILSKIGCEYKDHEAHVRLDTIMVTTKSIGEIYEWADEYKSHVNYELFQDSVAMGWG